jgi:arsenate reductase (thioredoxin)
MWKGCIATASPPCCSCAPTTPDGLRWPSDFFDALTGDRAVAWSGGSEPGYEVNPAAIAAMAERGIDISSDFPKPWTDETVRAADVVITMGCGDACLIFPGKRYESWDGLDDPAGLDTAGVRPIRDDIERRVRLLIDELGLIPHW